jgi:hypothetical protein
VTVGIGEVAETSIVVSGVEDPGAHLLARARPDDEATSIDDWAGALVARVSAAPIAGGS